MEHYNIQVGSEAEEFCLATSNGWVKVAGHSIIVDQYQFSAAPIKNFIRVSEIESGAKVFDVPVPDSVESYEETITFLEMIVSLKLIQLIRTVNDQDPGRLDREIEQMRKKAFETCGEKPPIEKVNIDSL